VGRRTGTQVELIACSGRENRELRLAPTLGGNAASSGAPRPRAAGSALRNSFQLLDFSELTRCHLHHQIEDRLLSDFSNLYELHGAKSNPRGNSYHPLKVAGILPHRQQEARGGIRSAEWPDTVLWIAVASAQSQRDREGSAPRIVALTGFMGAGKTKIGRALAELLGWEFVDLDHEIEIREKMPISDIFRHQGEPQFRQIETATLGRVLADVFSSTVIALGGGTFIQTANAELLREAVAQVVFLEPTVEEMLERCRIETQSSTENLRPLAADSDAFRALYAQRLSQYRMADLTVNTAGNSVEDNARKVAASLHFGDDGS
jgi:shikimate kinase